jgi:hypothetical protein
MPCRGKSKCFAMHLAASPLQACHNTHSKLIKDVEHEAANMANKKTKANRGNPAAAVVAPTRKAGKTNSTEATTLVTKTPAAHSTVAVAVTPPKAPQILRHHSKNSTIGTIAIPMAVTPITITQAPPVRNPVSITNMRPPGST